MSLENLFPILLIAAAAVTLAADLIARYLSMRDSKDIQAGSDQTVIVGSDTSERRSHDG
jgi:hypothetical protein